MPDGPSLLRANLAVVRGMLGRERLRLGAIALLITLGLLGALQYRWLREVADAQRSRMRSDAAARAAAIAQDFDREITRAFLMLPLDAATVSSRDASVYAARYDEFRRASRFSGLVKDVYLLEAGEGEARALLRFSQAERRLLPAEWPRELERLRARLENPGPTVLADVPALVVPVPEAHAGLAATPAEIRTLAPVALHHLVIRRAQTRARGPCTILLLDRGVLTTQLLPEIVARRLSADGGEEYEASVVDSRSGASLYGSAAPGEGDARAELFRLRLEELDKAILKSFVPEALRQGVGERVSVRVVETVATGEAPAGRWRLLLRHKSGSVEQAVQAALLRNLAIGFSVLALLGGSAALIGASARRERLLAARQMEFVAGVSHELRTPLAVIRSAGENLADGVVSDPSQVRRYGGLVRDEGLRLSEMVEQVLSFAGAHAPVGERKRLDLAAVVERALAAEAREGFVFERDVPAELPAVLGDAPALERAIANLLSNARKYGGPERKVAISVRALSDGDVAVTVSDRGPGIEADERERLFEPFFRGRRAREAQAPGSGLGLAIVRRIAEGHGGRVEVVSEPGRGASFTIVLPAAPDADAAAASDVQTHPAG